MFTSRAEYRLLLREDNADLRLTEIGRDLGLVEESRWRAFEAKRESIERERQRLRESWVRPELIPPGLAAEVLGEPLKRECRAIELLARPGVDHGGLARLIGSPPTPLDRAAVEQIEIQCRYQGYIARQESEIERQLEQESRVLPADFDFAGVRGLSAEVREKLIRVRPVTLGQAARIPGVTPAAVSLLLIHLRRRAP
jgi:tRNA uridine 5-carboxymethylaminomethyl modification enzyme